MNRHINPRPVTRREMLSRCGMGFGALALTDLMKQAGLIDQTAARGATNYVSPLAPKAPHFAPKARHVIHIFLNGGCSHVDTFDPKPKLKELHLSVFNVNDERQSAMASGKRYYVESPFRFHKVGQCGADMSTGWRYLAGVADDICFYRGLQADSVDHPTACYQLNTGNRLGGDPAIGSWTTYGLGTLNQNLPAFVVLPEGAYPQGGAANWSSGFLPAHFQGTPLRPGTSPILDLTPAHGVTRAAQRANLDLLAELNAADLARHPQHKPALTELLMGRVFRADCRPLLDDLDPWLSRDPQGPAPVRRVESS